MTFYRIYTAPVPMVEVAPGIWTEVPTASVEGCFDSLEAAKAAAEAHWRERLMECLEVVG